MGKFPILILLSIAVVLSTSTALITASDDLNSIAVRPYRGKKCRWTCRRKTGKCYSRCKRCCKGKICRITKCNKKCFARGCKRSTPPRSCRTKCIRRGRCYRRCKRCCTFGRRARRCKRTCTGPCYKRGCRSRSISPVRSSPTRVCRRVCIKRGRCFAKCRRCCWGSRCKISKCAPTCFRSGCRLQTTKCFQKCVRRGRCFRSCRRCCTGSKCRTTGICSKKCYRSGCSSIYTASTPNSCNCKRSTSGGGMCYYYPKPGSYYCRKRACKPMYKCVSYKTGLRCIRRLVTKKVVSIGGYKCTTKNEVSYMNVPYSK